MTKKEFLNILYEQLSDQMPEAKASAHTQYYHDYIQDAIKRGQKEKQVLDSLGDPRLIAKTLIDTDAEPSVFSGTNTSDYSGQDIYHTCLLYTSETAEFLLCRAPDCMYNLP